MINHHHPQQAMLTNYTRYQSSAGPATIVDDISRQTHGTDQIGRPILFTHGQFSGSTIRAELREIQQAELGRKYGTVDRRPLDPPPVVELRLFRVYHGGTEHESEKEISNEDIQLLGLMCTIDLFPIPSHPKQPPGDEAHIELQPSTTPLALTSRFPIGRSQLPLSTILIPPDSHSFSPSSSSSSSDIAHYFGPHPIRESSKMTNALSGGTFVQPVIIDYQGRKSIMFVFPDIAVRAEGTYILRYRFFDIFNSKPGDQTDFAVQAECYGGPFRVYSSKDFPGLRASTELTKQLARWGVRVNTRETERRRRKTESAPQAQKRKRPSEGADGLESEADR